MNVERKSYPEFTFWWHVNNYTNKNGDFNSIRMKEALQEALKQERELNGN